jgi:NAD(P)-dependent dehydrogenase (short-subunit alcohol dehydrogenase family)
MALRLFRDSVAVITGGASGIGRALGHELAKRGARVVLADLQGELAGEEAAAIRRAGGGAVAVQLDVRDATAMDALAERLMAEHGRVDLVFNNAGTGSVGEVLHLEQEDWDLVLGVNLTGVINGIRAFYPRMAKQGFGHIVNTASVAGLGPAPLAAPYATTKHAVVGLSRTLRVEAARHGVRVSALCPGVVRTPLLSGGVLVKKPAGYREEAVLGLWEKLSPVEPEPFARSVLDAVARNRGFIVLPRRTAFVMRLLALFPALEEPLARRMLESVHAVAPELFRGADGA